MNEFDDAAFLAQLRQMFRVEATEHVQAITAGLLELESARAPDAERKLVETVFRAAHSLKGAARAVEWPEIEAHCESLEEVFGAWRRAGGAPDHREFDALHRMIDAVAQALAAPADFLMPAPPAARSASTLVSAAPPVLALPPTPTAVPAPAAQSLSREQTVAVAPQEPARPVVPSTPSAADSTVRIAVAQLESRLLRAEEMLGIKLTLAQRAEDLRALRMRIESLEQTSSRAAGASRLLRQAPAREGDAAAPHAWSDLLDLVEHQAQEIRSLDIAVSTLARAAARDDQTVGQWIDELLADSRKLLRLPLSSVTAALPKLVRDLCREQGKEVELHIVGDELELDKRILEEIKDPLIHLLRNAIDHGIESPDARQAAGKPSRATLALAFSQLEGNRLELLVEDDGAGIDASAVRRAAIDKAQRSPPEIDALSESAALALVFESGLSTRAVAGHISGRGLGLAIVRERAEKLGGSVAVESQRGQGTRFRIVVPSMLATFRGVLVEASARRFVLPTASVTCVARVSADEVRTIGGRETIPLGGRPVALVRLAELLSLPPGPAHAAHSGAALPTRMRTPVVVLGEGEQRIAFAVDTLIDEQEVLVKPFTSPLVRLRHVAAATVLGSGEVAPILDVGDLMRSARQAGGRPRTATDEAVAVPARAGGVLVAEDSITSRMLIRNVLESAGYRVQTAVDGIDAYLQLRAGDFDLLVSDVEMPRLDGFGLTERIRADHRLAELPVVLLTALATPEDRERGVDAGANAYLSKSGFDQAELLETVRRFLSSSISARETV